MRDQYIGLEGAINKQLEVTQPFFNRGANGTDEFYLT